MLIPSAELWPTLETNSGQDEIIFRILETKLLCLLTLEDEGSSDKPIVIRRVHRMDLLV